ncbi:MAG: DUF4118 domain-containing protein [Acidobacteriia bacterium]|nr:DUF4118 domain-containing protein [Terriglobia bacterium]
MKVTTRQNWIDYAASAAGVAVVVALYKFLIPRVNNTTVALSFLLVVLLSASASGLGPAILASIAGMLCFNYFFLPPLGTFTIQDPQNWIALTAFLVTAIIASHLSSTARSRTQDAEDRRQEMWKLFQLGRAIIMSTETETAVSSIARQVVEIFHAGHCSVFIRDDEGDWQRAATAADASDLSSFPPSERVLDEVFESGETRLMPHRIDLQDDKQATRGGETIACTPLRVGVKSIGVLVMISRPVERETLDAMAGLVALALERARFLKELSRTEALRQSNELKSALLASVSHDLRTPLTSIRASIDNLLQNEVEWDKATLREFHLIISEEVGRLSRLVDNLLEMARIEARELRPSRQWGAISEVITQVLNRCFSVTQDHSVDIDLKESLPLVEMDSRLIAQALSNLVENAGQYSPPGTKILLQSRIESGHLIFTVRDHGPGIAHEEMERIFDKFYRGRHSSMRRGEGTGMGLPIARGIAEAHGGSIGCENNPEGGATFTLRIPVECKETPEVVAAGEEP